MSLYVSGNSVRTSLTVDRDNLIEYYNSTPRNTTPRGGYVGGNDPVLTAGLYAYVKAGRSLTTHFLDAAGTQRINVSEGRTQMLPGEYVGTTTGEKGTTENGKLIIRVKWKNAWKESRFLGVGNKIVEQEVVSYVYADDLDIRTAQVDIDITDNRLPGATPPPPATGSGSDTILYAGAGLAAILLLNPKKGKRR